MAEEELEEIVDRIVNAKRSVLKQDYKDNFNFCKTPQQNKSH